MSVGSVGASSSAYSYLQSLLQQQETSSGNSVTGSDPIKELLAAFYPAGANPPDPSTSTTPASGAGPSLISPETMASLISMQGQQWGQGDPVDAQAQSVFNEIDTNGDGQISKSEFESAFGSNADMTKVDGLFNALDTNGDGTISQDELTAAAQQAHAHHHHHHGGDVGEGGGAGGGGGGDGGLSALLSATDLSGATTQTTSNSDGSTSTTITYSDGSTVTMTTPASGGSDGSGSNSTSSNGSNSTSDSNLLEKLIKMQAELLSSTTSQVAVTA